ncbi:DUF1585 domain-containing protein [Sorangium sp. So ce1128]
MPTLAHKHRRCHRAPWISLAFASTLIAAPALAKPTAPRIFCDTYSNSPYCAGRLATCDTCHDSTAPVSWNAYGLAVMAAMRGDFDSSLPAALRAIEATDADGDGETNAQEIASGTAPGRASDRCGPLDAAAAGPAAAEPAYDVMLASRRVAVIYCGQSPSYEDLVALDSSPSPEDQRLLLHEQAESCLASAYWRDEGVVRIGDPLIRPVAAVNVDSPIDLPLADFSYDYRLFSYVLTGDRDARELLTAQYHVRRRDDGALERIEGVIDGPETLVGEPNTEKIGGQPLAPERRAGMITTQWFLIVNTMFSPLPRTTAAQAYRSYLGMDIARQEGIWPVAGEPTDIDVKGVAAPTCAQCHSTLDPLSYAFARYEGIQGPSGIFGGYNEARPAVLIPGWNEPQSVLFGTEVADVVAWARVAAESDAFKRNLAMLFFRHAFGRDPAPFEEPELEQAWKALPSDGYSANRLIHRIIDLSSFGGS